MSEVGGPGRALLGRLVNTVESVGDVCGDTLNRGGDTRLQTLQHLSVCVCANVCVVRGTLLHSRQDFT